MGEVQSSPGGAPELPASSATGLDVDDCASGNSTVDDSEVDSQGTLHEDEDDNDGQGINGLRGAGTGGRLGNEKWVCEEMPRSIVTRIEPGTDKGVQMKRDVLVINGETHFRAGVIQPPIKATIVGTSRSDVVELAVNKTRLSENVVRIQGETHYRATIIGEEVKATIIDTRMNGSRCQQPSRAKTRPKAPIRRKTSGQPLTSWQAEPIGRKPVLKSRPKAPVRPGQSLTAEPVGMEQDASFAKSDDEISIVTDCDNDFANMSVSDNALQYILSMQSPPVDEPEKPRGLPVEICKPNNVQNLKKDIVVRFRDINAVDRFIDLAFDTSVLERIPTVGTWTPNEEDQKYLSYIEYVIRSGFDFPAHSIGKLLILPVRQPYSSLQPLSFFSLIVARLVYLSTQAGQKVDPTVPFVELFVVPIDVSLVTGPSTQSKAISFSSIYRNQEGSIPQVIFEMSTRGYCIVEFPVAWKHAIGRIKRLYKAVALYAQVAMSSPNVIWKEQFNGIESGRFTGFIQSRLRSFWQMRKPRMDVEWPVPALETSLQLVTALLEDTEDRMLVNELPALSLWVFELFERISNVCLSRMLSFMDIDVNAFVLPENKVPEKYGSSVMRTYIYSACKNCGIHADLGLLTIAPRATVPGLHVFDSIKSRWENLDHQLDENQVCIFAGETLAKITNGAIRPTLHAVFEDGNSANLPANREMRMSMPFFQRWNPETVLSCNESTDESKLTVGEFTMNELYDNRWWRTPTNVLTITPDF
uniref:Isopenicillin N synthase-like Fe(2+) 2OG dioxygenase domain-containing protein n=1 Tax=Mucochytrium quahogii TaxID=96639 RepID=A0A7S2RRG0_9STRA|mmetsp:Transcript_14159/g.23139  ORF Transcript_14159/g.23139 Transcript_14159/m.23139 type:complete len:756 (-) Transcript_14159:1599-3866(-)|eukprot:CAMPEP_0203743674 /NCGR_PEP_ID=MMETSP0098-20131031/4_1 /ASSEMBLY_ACC=CAM_ASM_000208 /TAXON_ID=96639 /ORGANISM=" , Strain NY0313808BC1" /LENGTH=755 /DNA_ID=CAMNT_0050630985 /DNA_START=220 /DNA_END=2487 /DNA_ORIENTATION=+